MEINLSALQKYDPKVTKILRSALQVAIYSFNSEENTWGKTGAEGTMFICSRSENPVYAMMLLNKLNRDNFMEAITPNMEVAQESQQYLLYRKGDDYIRAIWFYNKQECVEFAGTLNKIIEKLHGHKQQPNSLAEDAQRHSATQISNKLNQTNVASEADLLSMLNKAQLKHLQETGVAKQPPVSLIKSVPIQLDSLMQSSTPVHGSPGGGVDAAATSAMTSLLGHRQRPPQACGGGGARLPSESGGDASTVGGGTELLHKILTGGANDRSLAKQAPVQQVKSLHLNQAARVFLDTPEPSGPPALEHPSASYSVVKENRLSRTQQNGSHFLLTPAYFEVDQSDFGAPALAAGVAESQKRHSSVVSDKSALKRAFIDLLEKDDEFVDLLVEKLSAQLGKIT